MLLVFFFNAQVKKYLEKLDTPAHGVDKKAKVVLCFAVYVESLKYLESAGKYNIDRIWIREGWGLLPYPHVAGTFNVRPCEEPIPAFSKYFWDLKLVSGTLTHTYGSMHAHTQNLIKGTAKPI